MRGDWEWEGFVPAVAGVLQLDRPLRGARAVPVCVIGQTSSRGDGTDLFAGRFRKLPGEVGGGA